AKSGIASASQTIFFMCRPPDFAYRGTSFVPRQVSAVLRWPSRRQRKEDRGQHQNGGGEERRGHAAARECEGRDRSPDQPRRCADGVVEAEILSLMLPIDIARDQRRDIGPCDGLSP